MGRKCDTAQSPLEIQTPNICTITYDSSAGRFCCFATIHTMETLTPTMRVCCHSMLVCAPRGCASQHGKGKLSLLQTGQTAQASCASVASFCAKITSPHSQSRRGKPCSPASRKTHANPTKSGHCARRERERPDTPSLTTSLAEPLVRGERQVRVPPDPHQGAKHSAQVVRHHQPVDRVGRHPHLRARYRRLQGRERETPTSSVSSHTQLLEVSETTKRLIIR